VRRSALAARLSAQFGRALRTLASSATAASTSLRRAPLFSRAVGPALRRRACAQLGPGGVREVASFDTADGLYDCCWSESHEHLLVSASGDGSVKVWDCSGAAGSHGSHGPNHAQPLRSLEEHRHEVYAVSWNLVRRDCFLSASWDDTVKLWCARAAARRTLEPPA